jgi:DNA-binding MarR family transcriptional regulator
MPGSKPPAPESRAAGPSIPRSFADWSRQRPDIDKDVQQVRAHLITIGARIRHDNDKIARKYGISGADMRILFALLRMGPPFRLRPTDLFESLLIPSATMTRQIERLARLKYIERAPDPDDGRVILASLTAKGAAVADAALTEGIQHSRVTKELQGALSPRELATLSKLLGRVTVSLD